MIDFTQPPVHGTITQGYHEEHRAYDFACVTGDPVFAVHSGELTSDYNGRMGNIAIIKYNGRTSTYSHLEVVSPSGWYERGEVIGLCGNTGSWSTGPHVHFESDQPYTFYGQ